MNGLGHLCNLHWAVTGVTRKGWDTGRGNPFDDLLSCLVGVTRCRLGPAQSPLSWAGDTLCSAPLADIPDIIFIHHMKIDIYVTNNNKSLQCTSSSSQNLFLRCKRWISSPTRVGGCCCCFPHQQTNNTAQQHSTFLKSKTHLTLNSAVCILYCVCWITSWILNYILCFAIVFCIVYRFWFRKQL